MMPRRRTEHEDSPMAEMFLLFPHESAVVMQRGIELGIICSCLLVLHCAMIVVRFWDTSSSCESVLHFLCMVRVVCAVARPYFWCHRRKLFVEARCQPTPQQVTQRLLDITAHPFAIERCLLLFYYWWLVGITIAVWITCFEGGSDFTQLLWRHCVLNFCSIILHRISCVLLFCYLTHSDMKRGIPLDLLEKYTKCFPYSSGGSSAAQLNGCELECSICFGPYIEGEHIRKLHCRHHFHRRCVDVWLVEHQNKCPLCLRGVGPIEALRGT
mmetsp:Transcript_5329/g.12824  ORF Transcript_5329/g.12824 Transcript_5329/m.12824 type:complete len:270 (-) Transcript_5329:129-938(-)